MMNTIILDDRTVEVPLARYEALLVKAEHYDNIAAAAISGAEIPAWRDEIQLDTDAVEEYLKVVERDRVTTMESQLLAEREARLQEAQEETK